MKKSILIAIILTAALVALTATFTSALKAYGEVCESPSECGSGYCVTPNPEAASPDKFCGCRSKAGCATFPLSDCSESHHTCISDTAQALGASCRSSFECESSRCLGSACACWTNDDCPSGQTCSVPTGQCGAGILRTGTSGRISPAATERSTDTSPEGRMITQIRSILARIRERLGRMRI